MRRPTIIGVLSLAFGLAAPVAAEADELRLEDRYTSLDGVTHSVWTRGIEVYDRYLGTNVDAAGRLINVTGTPLRDHELNTVTPRLSARATRARFGGRTRLVAFGTRLAWRVDRPDANAALVYGVYPDQRVTPRTVNLAADPAWIDRSEGGTKLQGNNAHASTFVEFTGDPVEVAQTGGNWSFPVQFFNQAGCPAFGCTFDHTDFGTRLTNREQTATQTFYYVNHVHDWALKAPIGFDEASRNFEQVNTSGQGTGGDAINILTNHQLPDGQWVHAADGSPPEMRLGRTNPAFGFPYDVRINDSAAIVYHEYAHGLTGRLVGAGTGCCAGSAGSSLAEGWSDWYAMDMLVAEGDVADSAAPGEVKLDSSFNAGGRTEAMDCAVGASATACPGAGTAGTGGYTFGDFGAINPAFPLEGLTTQEIAERSAGNLLPVPWIEARDVAEAVLYLAGESGRYVTGTTLVLDAGLLTR